MVFLAILAVAGSAFAGSAVQLSNESIIRTWTTNGDPPVNMAKSATECTGNPRPKAQPMTIDLVVAIDTSACNYYRIDQAKNTLRE